MFTRTQLAMECGYAAAKRGEPCNYPGASERDRGAWEMGWRSARNEMKLKTARIVKAEPLEGSLKGGRE